MKIKLISLFSDFYQNKVSEKHLSKIQEFLFVSGIFTEAYEILSILTFLILLLEIAFILIIFILNTPAFLLAIPFFIIPAFIVYCFMKQEKRAAEVERSAPDFLRQLASMLQVGLSFESAMDDISKYGKGPLYDEMRRTLLEIKIGRNFDEAWISMSNRLNSKELERVFIIILDGRKSGSSLADVIMDISNDLRDILALKRERKSSVMMAVMFLIIAAIIASPFSLGMVSVYGGFMESFGKTSEVITYAPIAGQCYLVIHSFLIGIIMSLVMYGEFKKGIKFAIPLVFVSYGIYFVISSFGSSILLGM